VPYIYVPSKEDLGTAGCTKRPTSVIMVVSGGKGKNGADKESEYKESYDEMREEVLELNQRLITTV
jgi:H/ACA ribonucleoprotein complex subunit 2